MTTRARVVVAAGCAALSVLVALVVYGSSGRDDSHITFWAARALAEGYGLVNYNGEPVEQSSSLLHVLVLALLRVVSGADVAMLGLVVGLVSLAAATAAASWVVADRGVVAAVTAAAVCGLSVPMVYWAVGGLETTLVAALWLALVLALDASAAGRVRWWCPALLSVLVVLVRPESFVVLLGGVALLGVGAVVFRSVEGVRAWSAPLWATAAAGSVSASLLGLWRLQRDGSWWPRPGQVKVEGVRFSEGAAYAWATFGQPVWWMLAVCAAAGMWWCVRMRVVRLGWWASGVWAAAMTVLVVAGGGDWMEAGRLFAPSVALAAVPCGLGVAWLVERASLPVVVAVGAALVVGLVVSHLQVVTTTSLGRPLWVQVQTTEGVSAGDGGSWAELRSPVHHRDVLFAEEMAAAVDDAVAAADGRRVRVASGQAGMVAYHLFVDRFGQLEFMDRFGLSSSAFDRCATGSPATANGYLVPWEMAVSGCADRPDVIFDLGRFDETPALADAGFVLVHQQEGRFAGPGEQISAEQFVAVHRSLLD